MIPKPTPLWKGPIEDGITQSLIASFTNCPFRFYLQVICGLEDNTDPHPNLVWGDCYHVGLEHLVGGSTLRDAKLAALEHLRTNYNPHQGFPYESYQTTIPAMLGLYDLTLLPEGTWVTELEFDTVINGFRYRGKMDGLLEGVSLLEHKCKNLYAIDPILLAEEIEADLQCNMYMHIAEVETVYYDLIGIPESVKYGAPYRPKDMSLKEYAIGLIYGSTYKRTNSFPVTDNTHVWIHQTPQVISAESQHTYWQRTITPLTQRIAEWYDYVTSPEFDPNNPECYNSLFYVTPVRTFQQSNTEKFKCNYHAYLTNQEDITNLRKIKGMFQELPSANTE